MSTTIDDLWFVRVGTRLDRAFINRLRSTSPRRPDTMLGTDAVQSAGPQLPYRRRRTRRPVPFDEQVARISSQVRDGLARLTRVVAPSAGPQAPQFSSEQIRIMVEVHIAVILARRAREATRVWAFGVAEVARSTHTGPEYVPVASCTNDVAAVLEEAGWLDLRRTVVRGTRTGRLSAVASGGRGAALIDLSSGREVARFSEEQGRDFGYRPAESLTLVDYVPVQMSNGGPGVQILGPSAMTATPPVPRPHGLAAASGREGTPQLL